MPKAKALVKAVGGTLSFASKGKTNVASTGLILLCLARSSMCFAVAGKR